jgi:nitrite reductase/ring-hydroxylating ferredoxin subunit
VNCRSRVKSRRNQILSGKSGSYEREGLFNTCAGISLGVLGEGTGCRVTPLENIVVTGVAAIPALLAETVELYKENRAAFAPSWRPQHDSMSSRHQYSLAADTAVTLGLVGAVGAAATGLTDWQDIDPPARRIGLVHGLLNVASMVLFGASLVARRRRSRVGGRSLAALGYAVSVAAARLGGNLVYEQKIGADHSNPEKLPDDFSQVLSESNLPDGKPVRVDHDGSPILLVRLGSQIYALVETCSHLGGPLSEGKLEGKIIECPWHGSRFSIRDGQVVDGPAVHPQPCLEARLRNGQVEVRKPNCRVSTEDEAPTTESKTH